MLGEWIIDRYRSKSIFILAFILSESEFCMYIEVKPSKMQVADRVYISNQRWMSWIFL